MKILEEKKSQETIMMFALCKSMNACKGGKDEDWKKKVVPPTAKSSSSSSSSSMPPPPTEGTDLTARSSTRSSKTYLTNEERKKSLFLRFHSESCVSET